MPSYPLYLPTIDYVLCTTSASRIQLGTMYYYATYYCTSGIRISVYAMEATMSWRQSDDMFNPQYRTADFK